MKRQAKTAVYMLTEQAYAGDIFQARFAFNATSDDDAKSKALNWAIRHSKDRRTVSARPAVGDELLMSCENSWVR